MMREKDGWIEKKDEEKEPGVPMDSKIIEDWNNMYKCNRGWIFDDKRNTNTCSERENIKNIPPVGAVTLSTGFFPPPPTQICT